MTSSSQDMLKKLLTLGGFVFLAPLTIFITVRALVSSSSHRLASPAILGATSDVATAKPPSALLTDSTTAQMDVTGEPLVADARPIIIKNYLTKWGSPLAKYSNLIVTASDNNGVDPFLVVAIAQQESNLGRRVIANCFNAWGWAQTSTYTRCFDSWDQGIKDYISEFSQNYIKRGLTTPTQIMTRYNPTSPDGSWAKGVAQFLDELENFSS